MQLKQFRYRLEQEKGRLVQANADLDVAQAAMVSLIEEAVFIDQAAVVVKIVAQQTQEQFTWHVNDMVAAAVRAILPDTSYKFSLEFVQRRNVTEADVLLVDHAGNKIRPKDSEGGGLAQVVAFALRICLWSLEKKGRRVFILDEPFSFLHGQEAHLRVSRLLAAMAERFGLQIIMVTSEEESEQLINGADRVFNIHRGGLVRL